MASILPLSTTTTTRRGHSPGCTRHRRSEDVNGCWRARPAAAAFRSGGPVALCASATNGAAGGSPRRCLSYAASVGRGRTGFATTFRRAAAFHDASHHRHRVALAASGNASGGAQDADDPVVDNVERASKLLDQIINETVEQIFVEEATEEVIPGEDDDDDDDGPVQGKASEAPGVDKEAILRGVILKHLEEFDGSFMAAISAYVQVAEASGDFTLLSILAAIREEVLAAVSGEMKPEIQVVQLVARLVSKEDRLEVLRAAHRGGGKAAGHDVPGVPIEKVENAAARLVDEFEGQENVPNWQLLYSLLLVRETCRQLHPNANDIGVYDTTVVNASFSPSEIPRAEAALIKEICVVDEPMKRRAFIMDKWEQCRELDEYRDPASEGKVKLKRTARGFAPRREEMDGGRGKEGTDVFDVRDIRPGRLIDCIINMRVALKLEKADPRIVDRLSAMYFECCDVVLEQADKAVKAMDAEERTRTELG